MALQAAFLDAGPLGLVTQRPGKSQSADACKTWAGNLIRAGVPIFVPEIADYEVRRELIRTGSNNALVRLDAFITEIAGRYLPLSTVALREAARLWAEVRNAGRPTAPPHALDGDVILAAQVITFCGYYGLDLSEIVVATVNVRHISRFVPSNIWQNIRASDDENATA